MHRPFARVLLAGALGTLPLWAGAISAVQAQSTPGMGVTTIAALTPPLLPESLAADATGTIYSAWQPTGEVVRIAPDGSRMTLATIQVGPGGAVAGVAVEPVGTLLVVARSAPTPGTDAFGVWRIRPDGSKQLAGALPPGTGMNDVLPIPGGGFYVTDSAGGAIYRVTPAGTAEKWLEHDLLKPNQQACTPGHPGAFGANGLTFAPDGSLLVANTDTASIVRVPVNADASAGAPAVWAGPDCAHLLGVDGITADGRGGVYGAVGVLNAVVQVGPSGTVRTLATAADGLDTPTSVKRGSGRYAGSLLVANGALSAVSPALAPYRPGPEPRPSILALGPTRLAGTTGGVGLPRTGSGPAADRPGRGLLPALAALWSAGFVAAGAALRHRRRPQR